MSFAEDVPDACLNCGCKTTEGFPDFFDLIEKHPYMDTYVLECPACGATWTVEQIIEHEVQKVHGSTKKDYEIEEYFEPELKPKRLRREAQEIYQEWEYAIVCLVSGRRQRHGTKESEPIEIEVNPRDVLRVAAIKCKKLF